MRTPEPLDAEIRAVIDAARGGDEPNELARARVRQGVEVKLAAGIALVGPAASAFAGVLKVTAAVVAVGSAVAAGVYLVPRYLSKPAPAHAPAAHVAARPAPAVVGPPPAEVEAPETVVAPPARPHARRRAASVAAAGPARVDDVSGLKEETALLGAANAALGHGELTRALSLLDDYDHRPGSGLLGEERAVTGILASCAAGHVDVARAEARHFRARWPRSPLAARVDTSCAGPGHPTPPAR